MNAKELLEQKYPDLTFGIAKNTESENVEEWNVTVHFGDKYIGLISYFGFEMQEERILKDKVNKLIEDYEHPETVDIVTDNKLQKVATAMVVAIILAIIIMMIVK
jgi:hypothetical protein